MAEYISAKRKIETGFRFMGCEVEETPIVCLSREVSALYWIGEFIGAVSK